MCLLMHLLAPRPHKASASATPSGSRSPGYTSAGVATPAKARTASLGPKPSPVALAVAWYFREAYGRIEGPGTTPFYCDAARVGYFAVASEELVGRDEEALFRLFVGFAMFQARRDVLIMAQQRAMPARTVATLTSPAILGRRTAQMRCSVFSSATAFDAGCTVAKPSGGGGAPDCSLRPGAACQVKEAAAAFNRMGDMGKLPTSAWLQLQEVGGFAGLLRASVAAEVTPAQRAQFLVERLAGAYRVGRKLATMFVSALSTPELAPGLTPWFPEVDGHSLVIVDTHVARAADTLRPPGTPRTYAAREAWVREQARGLDLRDFHPDVPRHSPRLVQQALYAYGSRSNRLAQGDDCAKRRDSCVGCARELCPFAGASGRTT